ESVLGPVRETGPATPTEGRVGASVAPEAARRIVQGKEPFTFDEPVPGGPPLVLRVVTSPHAHARITSIDTTAALALPGVVAVFTHL
ncbi:hypothetical protein ACSTLL_23340, partial [Vibrio parahaemolyticus]